MESNVVHLWGVGEKYLVHNFKGLREIAGEGVVSITGLRNLNHGRATIIYESCELAAQGQILLKLAFYMEEQKEEEEEQGQGLEHKQEEQTEEKAQEQEQEQAHHDEEMELEYEDEEEHATHKKSKVRISAGKKVHVTPLQLSLPPDQSCLISPPSSPPVGWNPMLEAPPIPGHHIEHDDSESSEPHKILFSGNDEYPSITLDECESTPQFTPNPFILASLSSSFSPLIPMEKTKRPPLQA